LNNGTIVTGTLGALDVSNNTFPVTFATDHLTYFALGDNLPPAQTCTNAALTVSGAQGKALDFVITKSGGGWSYQGTLAANATAPASATLNIGSAPTGAVVVTVNQDNTLLADFSTVTNLCASPAQAITVVPRSTPVSTVTVSLREVCSQNSTAFSVVPGVAVAAVTASGIAAGNQPTGPTGTVSFSGLQVGSIYTLKADGFPITPYTVLASGNSVTISKSVSCSVITGG